MNSIHLALLPLALLFCLPLLIPAGGAPLPGFHGEWAAAALGLLAAFALVGARRLPLPGATRLALALAALTLLQLLSGHAPVPQLAALFGLALAWAALLAALGRHLADELGLPRLCRTLATALFAGALCAALAGLSPAGWLPFGLADNSLQQGGLLGQLNQTTAYLWLGLASALYLAGTRSLPVPLVWTGIGLLLLCATLAGQRSTLLHAAVFAAVPLWLVRGRDADTWNALKRPLAGALLLLLLLQAALPFLPAGDATQLRPTPAARLVDETRGEPVRLALWRVAGEAVLHAPLRGHGIGSYPGLALEFADALPPQDNPGSADHAHNLLVELAAELGLPAALLVLAGSGLWIIRLRAHPPAEAAWAGSVVLMLMAYSLVEYPLWYAYFLGPLALLAGACGDARTLAWGRAGRIALVGWLIWCSVALVALRRDHAELTTAHALGRQPASLQAAAQALGRIGPESLLLPWVTATACMSLDPLRVAPADGRAVCTPALAFAPTIDTAVNAAVILWRSGETEHAVDLLRRLHRATRRHGDERYAAVLTPLQEREPALRMLLENRP